MSERSEVFSESGIRLTVGYAAVVATIPYLALKVAWLSGGTVGMAKPEAFSGPVYTLGNLLTAGMDLIAVLIALAFTHAWGLRIPAWLVLFPAWVATGFLAPIVVVMPFASIAFGDPAADPGPLRSWVYLFVYGGFAVQGLLLSAAFALYARARWGHALAGINGDGRVGMVRVPRIFPTASATSLAVVVGGFHLAWALGSEAGMSDAFLSDPPVAYRLTNGVYAAFAFGAAAGLSMLVCGWPRRIRFWVPLSLTWVGSGSLLAWGLWQTATMVARPELGAPLLAFVMPAKALTGALAGVAAFSVLRGRFYLPRNKGRCLPSVRRDA